MLNRRLVSFDPTFRPVQVSFIRKVDYFPTEFHYFLPIYI